MKAEIRNIIQINKGHPNKMNKEGKKDYINEIIGEMDEHHLDWLIQVIENRYNSNKPIFRILLHFLFWVWVLYGFYHMGTFERVWISFIIIFSLILYTDYISKIIFVKNEGGEKK